MDTKGDIIQKGNCCWPSYGQGKYWLRKLNKICKQAKKKNTAGTTEVDIQTAKQTIPKTLEMPSWSQHLLGEVTSIKDTFLAEVKNEKKTPWQ